ncbi:hypothetical protein ACKKBG_A06015 [Auxenochlorella protothecoides x Auxenochlorella symbiontica]
MQESSHVPLGMDAAGWRATLAQLGWHELCDEVSEHAQTELGMQACRRLLPTLGDAEASQGLLTLTAALTAAEQSHGAQIELGSMRSVDAARALQRADQGGQLRARDLLAILSVVEVAASTCRRVSSLLEKLDGQKAAREVMPLAPFQDLLEVGPDVLSFRKEVLRCLDEDASIRAQASPDVARCRQTVASLRLRAQRALASSGEVSEWNGRFCLALNPADPIPSGSILLGGASGGGLQYHEPPVALRLNNALAAALGELNTAENAVLWRLSEGAQACHTPLAGLLHQLVELDTAVAKARFGWWIDGHVPALVGLATALELRRLRHPLLVAAHLRGKAQAAKSRRRLAGPRRGSQGVESNLSPPALPIPPAPVPIDVLLPKGVRAVVITGPNTGGKTAALTAAGLSVLSCLAGIPVSTSVPARIPAYSAVLADIGDNQSLGASLSTFSGHLARIQAVRKACTGRELVLLDEVGTGTDPTEGSALGAAVLQTLARGGKGGAALVLATTHHQSLTGLKYEDPVFENASVEIDASTLRPRYQLAWGILGRSHALAIAERSGLPDAVVGGARATLGKASLTAEGMVAEMERLRREVETARARAGEEERAAADLRRRSAARRASTVARETAAARQAQTSRAGVIDRALAELALVQKEQQAAKAERGRKEAALREAAAIAQERAARAERRAAWRPAVGEEVRVARLGIVARVLAVDAARKKVKLHTRLGRVDARMDELDFVD